MGPHSFKCGKGTNRTCGFEFNRVLQWGRTLSSAERLKSSIDAFRSSIASMGPHSFKCGKRSWRVKTCGVGEASMGPHSFKCGKLCVCKEIINRHL